MASGARSSNAACSARTSGLLRSFDHLVFKNLAVLIVISLRLRCAPGGVRRCATGAFQVCAAHFYTNTISFLDVRQEGLATNPYGDGAKPMSFATSSTGFAAVPDGFWSFPCRSGPDPIGFQTPTWVFGTFLCGIESFPCGMRSFPCGNESLPPGNDSQQLREESIKWSHTRFFHVESARFYVEMSHSYMGMDRSGVASSRRRSAPSLRRFALSLRRLNLSRRRLALRDSDIAPRRTHVFWRRTQVSLRWSDMVPVS